MPLIKHLPSLNVSVKNEKLSNDQKIELLKVLKELWEPLNPKGAFGDPVEKQIIALKDDLLKDLT